MKTVHVGRRAPRPELCRGRHYGHQWRAGAFWNVFVWDEHVTVERSPTISEPVNLQVVFYGALKGDLKAKGLVGMPSKWITQAMAKTAGKKAKAGKLDPLLSKERPALTDFMTELKDGDNQEREPSPLMVTLADAGGVRVGLKDETLGWCWREADTFLEALDAIEKALQSGDGAFRPAGGWRGKKKR